MLNIQSQAQIFDLIYPIGSIYISATLTTVEQVQALFGGKWEEFGKGRCLVGKSSETEFDTMLKTGGEKTHKLTIDELAFHAHDISMRWEGATVGSYWAQPPLTANTGKYYDAKSGDPIQGNGGDQPHNNLQPYIVVSMFRRTELGGYKLLRILLPNIIKRREVIC